MSKRNVGWLVAIGVVGVIVWLAAGWPWALLATGVTLVVSEVTERSRRRRRRTASS